MKLLNEETVTKIKKVLENFYKAQDEYEKSLLAVTAYLEATLKVFGNENENK